MTRQTTVALLHTVPSLGATFEALIAEEVGEVDVFHMIDESLLRDRIADRPVSRAVRRVAAYAGFAQESGAAAMLVTCSSIGEAVEASRPAVDIPLFRVDEPMAARAVEQGRRVGILATLRSTLEPTQQLIMRKAAEASLPSAVVTVLSDGAFEALRAGQRDEHDRRVAADAVRLAGEVDVLVLAQASMATVLATLPPDRISIPVLSSPRTAVRQLKPVLNNTMRTDPEEKS